MRRRREVVGRGLLWLSLLALGLAVGALLVGDQPAEEETMAHIREAGL